MQPLCNYVSTHVQGRKKGGFAETETQYLAKSMGKSAQVFNPGQGHLTELVEAMPFTPGYILSPREEENAGRACPKILLSPTTLFCRSSSLPLTSQSKDQLMSTLVWSQTPGRGPL